MTETKLTWHHPLCEGECFACLIERTIKKEYGEVGLRYLLKQINAAQVQQAEQEPVVKIHKYNEFQTLGSLNLPIGTKLYTHPVRTKHLTDDEIGELIMPVKSIMDFARAVIAADREKNK